ncbi:MAG: hypothetical protein IH991_21830, partial [Planctomycetes bacterium]|nr:hypothetical protein [Planctomycetota bacterium]
VIGRNEVNIPIITPLLGLASQQFLRIQIDGKLDEPNRPTREVLPALNDTIRAILYPEIAQRQRNAQ